MPRKPHRDQLSLESLLEPDVPLDPRVVTPQDTRFPQCLKEWLQVALSKPTGVDIEFWEDVPDDAFSVQIRLIQCAYTSPTYGPLCITVDFGGLQDDRAAIRHSLGDDGTLTYRHDNFSIAIPKYREDSFLSIFRTILEDPKRIKLFHHAKGDALRLRIALAIRCRGLRCTMLLSQLYWAGIKGVRHGLGPLSERAVAANAPNVWRVEKRLQKSEWRWRLSNAQINYAILDALVMEPLYSWMVGLIREAGMTLVARVECEAIAPFVEFEYNGMCVNPAMLDDHIAIWRRGRELAIRPFIERYPDVDPSKTQVVAVALSQDNCFNGHVFYELDHEKPRRKPLYIRAQRFDYHFKTQDDRYEKLTENGKDRIPHSVSEAALARFSHHPWISALLDWRSMGVVIKWMEGVRKRVRFDGRVRGEYAQIAGGENRRGDEAGVGAGMGRSACRAPSLQQSANPQPKLNKIIAQAMGWVGDAPVMSPRIPFVAHDGFAAAYAQWAAMRLRGETADPLASKTQPNAKQGGLQAEVAAEHGETTTASSRPVWDAMEGWAEDDCEDETTGDYLTATSPEWLTALAKQWSTDPRSFIVADFSQAHMRIAAQASRDPQLCEDFLCDRDAHLKLAYDFGVATKQIPADLPIEAFFAWYDKKHSKHKFVKSLRQPAKTGNYTSLNLGSVERLKQAGDTAKPPVVLTYREWEIIRDAWRKRYAGLHDYQRKHIRECNAVDVVIDGAHYGAAWSLSSRARLWLRKERDKFDKREPKYCADCGQTHGAMTVKGTDAVAFRWLRTEADAIKWALARILEEFDKHDIYWMAREVQPQDTVWDAKQGSMAHDEADIDCRKQYELPVAGYVRKWFNKGLQWAGLSDIPPEPRDAKDLDLVVKSWADK